MSMKKISEAILGVGVDDTTIDLFESQYPVPTGVSYNSYVILDEKTTILDTVDARATEPWLENLAEALGDCKPAYLVVSHMEPDHGANVAKLAALYPEMQVVGNAKTFQYMEQFFGADAIAPERRVVVKDGESLSLGAHTLTFVFAPMVHWPEVMVSYESSEKVLFSADGFGRFGAVAKFDENADWASEARRYYLNIVGKYGPQVQALLKKAAALDIKTICPLHGPVLTGDLSKYLNYYDLWSSYKAEEPEKILVASASIHGHTRAAAHTMAEKLRAQGAKVVEMDLTRTDVSYAVTEAFRCGKIVLACATYDGDGESADSPQDQELPEPHRRPDGKRHLGTHGCKAYACRAGEHEEHHPLRECGHHPLCRQCRCRGTDGRPCRRARCKVTRHKIK